MTVTIATPEQIETTAAMRHAGGPIAQIARIGPRHDAVLDYFFVTTGEW